MTAAYSGTWTSSSAGGCSTIVVFGEEPKPSAESLLAEAKAWREVADFTSRLWSKMTLRETGVICGGLITHRYPEIAERMVARNWAHRRLWDYPPDKAELYNQGASVMVWLLLALECEDEARALTPKSLRSAKRRRSPTQREK